MCKCRSTGVSECLVSFVNVACRFNSQCGRVAAVKMVGKYVVHLFSHCQPTAPTALFTSVVVADGRRTVSVYKFQLVRWI